MASPYDLPPWLTGDQDRGFLQGAQIGITAARTGTAIAETRQQMKESGELHPFRAVAAEIQNNLQRQQFDLGAATFANKVLSADLAVKGQIAQVGLSNLALTAKTRELSNWEREQTDLTIFGEQTENDPKLILETPPPRLTDPRSIAAYQSMIKWAGDTVVGEARAREFSARKLQEAGKINTATEQLKYGIDPYVYDKDGNPSALPDKDLLAMGANALEYKKRSSAQYLSDVSEGRQISVQENRTEGRLLEIDARADAIADGKIDVGLSSLELAQWKEKARMLREEAKLNGDYTRYREFVNTGGRRAAVGAQPENQRTSQIKDSIANAEKAKTDLELQPKDKQTPKAKALIEEQITQGKRLLAKDTGRVVKTWNQPWSEIEQLGFKEGAEVLVPADPDSTDPIANKEEHIIIWPGNDAMKKRWAKVKARLDEAAAELKRKGERKAAWMEESKNWNRDTGFSY